MSDEVNWQIAQTLASLDRRLARLEAGEAPVATGGTGSMSASAILASLSTVDGAGSGLDADLLDGQHAAAFAPTFGIQSPNPVSGTAGGIAGTAATPSRIDHVHQLSVTYDDMPYVLLTDEGKVWGRAVGAGAGRTTLLGGSALIAILGTSDGAGSGLDADLLDGQHAAAFSGTAHTHTGYVGTATYTANDVLTKLQTVDGAFSGLDADLLDGLEAAAFSGTAHTHAGYVSTATYVASDVLAKLLTVDGAGSGLDADLLDGTEAAAFAGTADVTAAEILTRVKTVDGPSSGLDADLLDGQEGSYFLPSTSYTASDVLTKIKTVDGTGSGLDSDLLDGKEATDFAQLGAANSFTENQTISKANPTVSITPTSGKAALNLGSGDSGSSWGGAVSIGRNSNASTPAAGFLQMVDKGNQAYNIWADDSGVLRINTALPTNANDTAGTVVGSQSSSLDSKDLLEGVSSIEDVLAAVQRGAEAVRRFTYKSGAYNGEEFEGVVVDYAPRYGEDRDADHPSGKSLNLINVVGDLLRAVAWLVEREQARGNE